MTFQGDPYRTLGLVPGASVNEIRSAYRRLAKRYHPDAAGERALPRFLAIQAAYEALVDANGNLRRGTKGTAPGPGPGTEAWRADSSRARASRDAWRARSRSGAPGAGAGPGASPGAGPETASGRPGDAGGATPGGRDRRPPGGQAEHHFRRHRRTATPGSTTYDEAAETPLDPAWDGGTWYGASSGTYWTLNPREYADPRKHGPEYRRRAWRAAGQRAHERDAASAGSIVSGPTTSGPAPQAHEVPRDSASRASATSDADGSTRRAATGLREDAASAWPPPPADAGVDQAPSMVDTTGPEALPGRRLGRSGSGGAGRVALAGIAAAPVPVVAGVILGAVAGCSAAGCPPLVPLLAVVAWGVAALVLTAVPAAAALGALAALVAGGASLLAAAILALAGGDPAASVGTATGSIGVVVYCFALVVGGARLYAHREPGPPAS